MDGVGFQPVNKFGEGPELLPDAPIAAPVASATAGPTLAVIRDFLTKPRSSRDLSKWLGRDVLETRKWIIAQLRRRVIVRTAYGRYARADCSDVPPDSGFARPRPVYDALLAYLAEPRRAFEIARHINSTVPIATGHMARLVRQGVVVRVAYGTYVRQDKCPVPPERDTIQRGRPVRARVVAAVDREKSLEAIVKATGLQESAVHDHLLALVREGTLERVGSNCYRPVPPDLFDR